MSNTFSHQTHRIMRVHPITKAQWDTYREHALKKARDSFVYPFLWKEGTEEDKLDPALLMIAFRYKGQCYCGHWEYPVETFDGFSVADGIHEITQVYYEKPSTRVDESQPPQAA